MYAEVLIRLSNRHGDGPPGDAAAAADPGRPPSPQCERRKTTIVFDAIISLHVQREAL